MSTLIAPPPPAPAALTPQQQLEKDIKEWNELKTWLKIAKEKEVTLRNTIAKVMFEGIKLPNGTFPEGTSKADFDAGPALYHTVLRAKLTRDIDEALMIPTLTEAALTPAEAAGLIRGKPELGVKAYKALPDAKRAIVDKMLIVKQGAIELEVDVLPK